MSALGLNGSLQLGQQPLTWRQPTAKKAIFSLNSLPLGLPHSAWLADFSLDASLALDRKPWALKEALGFEVNLGL